LDPNTPHPSLESESYSQTAAQEAAEMQRAVEQAQTYDQKVEQGIVAPETESAASDSEAYKGQQDDTSDPEIRRQAEEIIRALRESEDEEEFATAATSITGAIDQETSAIESTIQNSINASAASAEADSAETPALVMPGALAIQQALQNTPQVPPTQNVVAPGVPDVITPRVVPPTDEAATPENETTEVAIDPVEPERRILDEVREQQAMVAPTITDGDESSQDDRDMISMEKEQVVSTPEPEPAEMPAWTHKEPSSGEANRVDYQKLFDQLRDVQDQQES